MVEETTILGRHHGLNKMRRQIVEGDRPAMGLPVSGQYGAVLGDQCHGRPPARRFETADIGQVPAIPGGHADEPERQPDRRDERVFGRAPGELPACTRR